MSAAPNSAQRATSGRRARWEPPVVRRLEAGRAEVGTRVANDGAFTGS